MAFLIESNKPTNGSIRWSGLNMQYKGTSHAITNGYTNYIYAYWTPLYPTQLVVTNEFPDLDIDDCLVFVNKLGVAVTVPNASVITGDIIMPGTIMAGALSANSVSTDNLQALSISAGKIAAGAVTADTVAANAIGAINIAADAITSEKILADAITTEKIAAEAITSNEILANTITTSNIAAGAITASEIAANTITVNEIAANVGAELNLSSNETIVLKVEDVMSAISSSDVYKADMLTKADASDLTGLATEVYVQEINATEITQRNDAITLQVAQEKERAETVEGEIKTFTDTAQTYFTFELNGMTIGKAGSPFQTLHTNEKLSFMQSGIEVAYIQYNKLFIKSAEIEDRLTIGNASVGYTDMETKNGGFSGIWRAS